jgi:hypothetical protein
MLPLDLAPVLKGGVRWEGREGGAVASNAHVVLALAAAAVSAGKHHEGKT